MRGNSKCQDPTTAAAAAAKSLQSCPTLCDPIDSSPPGSPIPGILQARALEWVAISFSNFIVHQNHWKGFYNSDFPHRFSFNSSDLINCISNKFLDDPDAL